MNREDVESLVVILNGKSAENAGIFVFDTGRLHPVKKPID